MTNEVLVALVLVTNVWTNGVVMYREEGPKCGLCGQRHHDWEIGVRQMLETVTAIGKVRGERFEVKVSEKVLGQWAVTNEVGKEVPRFFNAVPVELPGGVPEILAGPAFRIESGRRR